MESKMKEVPFAAGSFSSNPEERCPCVLLLDTSNSMNGGPIEELNAGLVTLQKSLMSDPLCAKRVELSIITFGPVRIETDFIIANRFTPPKFAAAGRTPLGEAIDTAISQLHRRKEVYKANGIPYFRPWIFLITDGKPNDQWQDPARRVHAGVASKSFIFLTIGVGGANFEFLRQVSPQQPLALQGMKFRELFVWVSSSVTGSFRTSGSGAVILPSTSTWSK